MGFAAGFAAGSAAVDRGLEMGARGRRLKREEDEYQRQEAARASYHKLQEDYYKGQGDFAGAPGQGPDTALADASYNRVESQRLGLAAPDASQAPMPDSQGAMQPRGLSMTPQQAQGTPPSPMDPVVKDKLYYHKLGEWANTHLDPEKSLAFKNELTRMEETNYQQRRLTAFRQLSSGDRQGLENAFGLAGENGMIPKGAKVDLSQAVFDPNKGWTGIQVQKGNETQALDLNHDRMIGMFMSSDPAQLLKYRITMADQARADRAEGRADRKMGLEENADKRADRLADSTISTNAAQVRQGDARLGLEGRRIGLEQQRIGLAGQELDLHKQRLQLEEKVRAGDEKAKDVLTRQNQFAATYGAGRKLDPNSPTYAEDSARQDAGLQLAGLATSIYSMSAENAKPEARNAVMAETDMFIRAYDSGKLEKSKLKDNGDGTMTYGRLRVPSALFDSLQAPAPEEKKGVKKKEPKKKEKGISIPAGEGAGMTFTDQYNLPM